MKHEFKAFLVFFAFCLLPAEDARSQWSLDFETGVAINGYNDVQIPGDTGTRFSLSRELDSDPALFWRFRIAREFGERHNLSLLVAPLRLKSSGQIGRDISFTGVNFPAGDRLSARYRFDSYRLTYRYRVYNREKISAGLGLTAKIRDAEISLSDSSRRASKTNTGFVPLLSFILEWQFHNDLGLILEGDALAAPQGRAEDLLLAIYGNINNNMRIKAGYRMLEGGADNDEVYNFTMVNYLAAGIIWIM